MHSATYYYIDKYAAIIVWNLETSEVNGQTWGWRINLQLVLNICKFRAVYVAAYSNVVAVALELST